MEEPVQDQIHQAVETLLQARTWEESKHIVEAQRDLLLTDAADRLLVAQREQAKADVVAVRLFERCHDILLRCRNVGIEAAFADLVQAERLQTLLNFIEQQKSLSDMPRRVVLCQLALQLAHRDLQAEIWAYLQAQLAHSLVQNPEGERAENLEQAIAHLEQALEVYTQQTFAEEWARIQYNLGHVYCLRIRGEQAENIEQAIAHLEQALLVRTQQALPQSWAMTQNSLGNAYNVRLHGERASNVERAIFYYHQALKVYTQSDFPQLWAGTQHNLASAYPQRLRGERVSNIEQAITHYEQALEIYTQQTYPQDWAMAQKGLGHVYQQRVQGGFAENQEQVISHYEQALEVYTRQNYPQGWAQMHNDLGIAYQQRLPGEQAENLEQAIAHYEQALEIYTQQDYPQDWAGIQHNLGIAYSERLPGERAENLEQAIIHYEQALEVRTRQATPQDWAKTQNNLANACILRIRGQRAENLEQAIFHYEQALEAYTRQEFPRDWAMLQGGLGNAYQQRIRGERAENLEQAIDYGTQALAVYTQQASPQDWAKTQNNLGIAYNERLHGERAENLEQAIFHYEQALEVRTRQAFPRDWARTQNNLANVYIWRTREGRANNIEQAIIHYKQALEVYTQQSYPQDWAMSQNGLGIAYGKRSQGERAENIEQAIWHLEKSLEVRTQQAFPLEWAETQSNLGVACFVRIQGERAEHIEQTILHSQQALKIYTREAFPLEWADLQNNLGLAYSDRLRGEQAENVQQAIIHFRQALEVSTPLTFPHNCRDSAYWLGRLLYAEQRFTEARQVLETAHQAIEALRGEMRRDIAKRSLAGENADLYARLVSCCLAEKDEAAAFKYAVAGKGRAFVDLLASARFDLFAASISDPNLAEDLHQARKLRQKIDALLSVFTGESSQGQTSSSADDGASASEQMLAQLNTLWAAEGRHWEQMAYKYPALTATQQAQVLAVDRVRSLSSELQATLVEYYQHAESWCAFIINPDAMYYVPLLQISDELIKRMTKWVANLENPAGRNQISLSQLCDWYDAVIAPLEKYLPKKQAVVLAPFGMLHVLPLAAACQRESRRYLAQDYQVSFAPSLSALHAAWEQTQRTGRERQEISLRLLNVAYPGATNSSHYLPNVLAEAQTIARNFSQITPLYAQAATPAAVLEQSYEQDIIHLGCHGWFDAELPEQSGLLLAGGWLTVQRIITELHLEQARVATLGACLSGQEVLQRGDEHIGLLQAILSSGVQAVVASLWSVDDAATRALFEAFYRSLVAGASPAQALQDAAEQVRLHPEWKHPYYWAAFQVSGLGHSIPAPKEMYQV
jgi:CHAT domain-containing protein/tetratricopeptide (TPR) repeat protein